MESEPVVANAWQQVAQSLAIPSYVYSDDGSEFKAEFKQRLDYYDVDKVVSREPSTKGTAGTSAARVLAQYNARTHGGTGVTPNQAYSDPSKAEHARQAGQAQRSASAHARCGG